MTTPIPQPGWYPDPAGGSGRRYWDGTAWGEVSANPMPAFPAPGMPPTGGWSQGPLPATKTGMSKGKKIALGAGVVLLALVVIGSIGNNGRPSSSKTTDAALSAPSKSGEAVASSPTVGMNQEIRDGKFAFTVTGMETAKTIGDSILTETAQGTYVVVSMTVKNIGNKAQSFSGYDQKLLDTAGREFSSDSAANYNLNQGVGAGFGAAINPGNQIPVKVAFDVPPGTQPSSLELHDSMFSGGVKVRLS